MEGTHEVLTRAQLLEVVTAAGTPTGDVDSRLCRRGLASVADF